MPNRVLNSNEYHSKSAEILVKASHWVADVVEHHHQHKILLQQVDHLKHLDHHMLSDMGVNEKALFEADPHIEEAEKSEDESSG